MNQSFITIRAFGDQDASRIAMSERAAEQAARLLLLMDLATAGKEGLPELEGSAALESRQYLAFRRWFGPQVHSALLSFAGDVLAATTVDGDGLVDLNFGNERAAIDPRATLAARLVWLVGEIAMLQSERGQLFPDEWGTIEPLLDEVAALDMAEDADVDRALVVWPVLETAYQHAQPGARIYRGDEKTVADARAWLATVEAQIAEKEAAIQRRAAIIGGDAPASVGETLEAIREAQAQVKELTAARDKAAQIQADKAAELSRVRVRIAELMLTLPEDVDPPE